MIFIMAGLQSNWWIGIPLFIAVLAAYDRLYDATMLPNLSLPRTIFVIVGLVLFQVVYWVTVFYLANYWLRTRAQ